MRTRTRPDVKWLINEVAMLAGELQRVDKEVARLAEHRLKVEQAHRACLQILSVVTEALPLCLPTVQQHRPYGGRGALRRLLLDALREVQPKALDTNQLTQLAVQAMAFDLLKVHHSLTSKVGASEEGTAFFSAVITMAHALGMRVVAEGGRNGSTSQRASRFGL